MSIIHILSDAIHNGEVSPEAAKFAERARPYHDEIVKAFGMKFLDGMCDAEADYNAAQYEACYERGFTDCFQLWLEVFSKYSS